MSKESYRQNLEDRVVGRAMKDEAYRKQLLSNPRAAVEGELGVKLPAEVPVKIVEMDSLNTLYILLPPAVEMSNELSDAELETVAGGLGGVVIGATCRGSGCGETAITILIGGGCSTPRGGIGS